MTDLEILAELTKAYELINDIRENQYGQLNNNHNKKLSCIMRDLENIYEQFYANLDIKDLQVREEEDNTVLVISKFIAGGYDIYDKDYKNTGDYVTCGDIDYCWYEDDKLISFGKGV